MTANMKPQKAESPLQPRMAPKPATMKPAPSAARDAIAHGSGHISIALISRSLLVLLSISLLFLQFFVRSKLEILMGMKLIVPTAGFMVIKLSSLLVSWWFLGFPVMLFVMGYIWSLSTDDRPFSNTIGAWEIVFLLLFPIFIWFVYESFVPPFTIFLAIVAAFALEKNKISANVFAANLCLLWLLVGLFTPPLGLKTLFAVALIHGAVWRLLSENLQFGLILANLLVLFFLLIGTWAVLWPLSHLTNSSGVPLRFFEYLLMN